MKAAFLSIFLLAPLVLAVTTFPDYPAKHAKECLVSVENQGVTVGLEPIVTVQEQKTYFGVNLTKKRFVPVFVVIENGMSINSAIFDKSKVTYGATTSSLSAPQTGTGTDKALAFSLIPFFGGFAGAQSISDATRIQDNLIEKQIQSTTISPGASARGFFYIPIGNNSSREKIALRIPIGKAGTDEDINLELMF
jgi:hypothetical protein